MYLTAVTLLITFVACIGQKYCTSSMILLLLFNTVLIYTAETMDFFQTFTVIKPCTFPYQILMTVHLGAYRESHTCRSGAVY